MRSFPRLGAKALIAAVALLAVGACDDPLGPEDGNFLIRTPLVLGIDNPPLLTVLTITVAATSTDSLRIEWQPVGRARAYEIAFWRAASREDMNMLQADFSTPAFAVPVASTAVVEAPYNPLAPAGDPRTVRVVRRTIAFTELNTLMEQAGVASGQHFFVWSVIADLGTRRVRSIQLKRMVINR